MWKLQNRRTWSPLGLVGASSPLCWERKKLFYNLRFNWGKYIFSSNSFRRSSAVSPIDNKTEEADWMQHGMSWTHFDPLTGSSWHRDDVTTSKSRLLFWLNQPLGAQPATTPLHPSHPRPKLGMMRIICNKGEGGLEGMEDNLWQSWVPKGKIPISHRGRARPPRYWTAVLYRRVPSKARKRQGILMSAWVTMTTDRSHRRSISSFRPWSSRRNTSITLATCLLQIRMALRSTLRTPLA